MSKRVTFDTSAYIDENLDDIIQQSLEPPHAPERLEEELEETEELMYENAELYHELSERRHDAELSQHESEFREFFQQGEAEQETAEDIDVEHLFSLLNIFTKYYNEKYDRVENYFTGIHENAESSQMMELFLEAIFEYTGLMQHFDIEDNPTMMTMFYPESDKATIESILNESTHMLYQCEIRIPNAKPLRIYSTSLLVCLNYIVENGFGENEWYVFTLTER